MAMLQLLIDAIQPPRHNLRLYPQLSHSRAIHTVEAAKMIWREATFTLVVGADLVPQLAKWYRVDELLQQVNLLVVPRPGYRLNEVTLNDLRQRGVQVTIADLSAPATSSTDYRDHHDPTALTPPIEDYIHREHLYAWQDDRREKQPIR
jgi:nicotinate-nucleotide adenylyltransferase